jgi:hypothetical protein
MIKYWIRLHEDKTNCILKAALDENNKMHNNGQHCWVSCIYYILKELDMLKKVLYDIEKIVKDEIKITED